jgi:anti-sigma B factor antagonist
VARSRKQCAQGGDDGSSAPDSVRIETVAPGARVNLVGRLSAATVADVRLALRDAVDDGVDDLELGLAGVELVDATGLGVLVATHRRADRAGRRLVLCDVPDRIARLLLLTRLNRVLHSRSSEVDASPLAG